MGPGDQELGRGVGIEGFWGRGARCGWGGGGMLEKGVGVGRWERGLKGGSVGTHGGRDVSKQCVVAGRYEVLGR